MKYPIYSYRDAKAWFGQPMIDNNDESAIRGFAYAINNATGIMSFSPSDFDLYKIGIFDSEKGTVEPVQPIQLVVSGSSVFGAK